MPLAHIKGVRGGGESGHERRENTTRSCRRHSTTVARVAALQRSADSAPISGNRALRIRRSGACHTITVQRGLDAALVQNQPLTMRQRVRYKHAEISDTTSHTTVGSLLGGAVTVERDCDLGKSMLGGLLCSAFIANEC